MNYLILKFLVILTLNIMREHLSDSILKLFILIVLKVIWVLHLLELSEQF